jgi:glucokinase
MKGKLYMGLDVGGSRISAGLVDNKGELHQLHRERTPETGEETREVIVRFARELMERATNGDAEIVGIGIGFGGPVDYRTQRVRRSHHKEGWAVNFPLAQTVGEELGLPVRIDNDANTACLGEAMFGAGRGKERVLYINVGTGIGGALVRDFQIYHGAHSNAGEIGHMVVLKNGPLCACGNHGCLEALASGTAMGRAGVEAVKSGRAEGSALLDTRVEDIDGLVVGELAVAGDEACVGIVEEAADWLALAAANGCNLWDPEAVIIGGGVSDIGETLMKPMRAAFRRYAVPPQNEETELYIARLGYDAGVIGAAALALTTL